MVDESKEEIERVHKRLDAIVSRLDTVVDRLAAFGIAERPSNPSTLDQAMTARVLKVPLYAWPILTLCVLVVVLAVSHIDDPVETAAAFNEFIDIIIPGGD